ncbi:putative ATP-dependent kinase Ecym_7380 [Eremothecium cymbalariae DBVPG|uniref:Phosphoribulokinase/uridine kinase domain-containing protein n=1 Tax=Eremothecium cymbalariae (strain CBS 270.75 / DBVPG 7215 / KCTC 17166 / NRRL Y-17582) TaxID=931890 RepID=G8JWJ1_ERECY|nr:hypothetical protein Ecym_7380 [Eremothecium cymbalariae DBVPG\
MSYLVGIEGLVSQFVEAKAVRLLKARSRDVNGSSSPIFILISGPQGSGKTYNATKLCEQLRGKFRTVGLSIDDFYLPYNAQQEVNKRFKDNPLLQGRGMPGTHDLKLLKGVISRLVQNEGIVKLPRYDKSKYAGKGDRLQVTLDVKLPVDFVILEGWFLGFQPVPQEELPKYSDFCSALALQQVNEYLKAYSDAIWRNKQLVTLGVVFATDDMQNVYRWRLQQEHELIKVQGTGMSDAEVVSFLDRYFVGYRVYYERLVSDQSLGNTNNITIGLDLQRTITYVSEK